MATVRDEKIIIKVAPEIKAELQAHCESMGVSMSGYLAVIIGQTLKAARTTENSIKELIGALGKEEIFKMMEGADNSP